MLLLLLLLLMLLLWQTGSQRDRHGLFAFRGCGGQGHTGRRGSRLRWTVILFVTVSRSISTTFEWLWWRWVRSITFGIRCEQCFWFQCAGRVRRRRRSLIRSEQQITGWIQFRKQRGTCRRRIDREELQKLIMDSSGRRLMRGKLGRWRRTIIVVFKEQRSDHQASVSLSLVSNLDSISRLYLAVAYSMLLNRSESFSSG